VNGRGCHRHLDVLMDLAAGLEVSGRDAERASSHLEGCQVCRHRVEATALAIVGLTRLRAEVAATEPSADAWDQLQRRVIGEAAERVRPSGRRVLLGLPMLSGLTAGLLTVSLMIPVATGGPASSGQLTEPGTRPPGLVTGADGRLPIELVRPEGDGPPPLYFALLASDPVDAIQPAARSLAALDRSAADGQGDSTTGTGPLPGGSRRTERRD
jgi:hypothetical protein